MSSDLRYSIIDKVILQCHNFIETIFNQSKAQRLSPAKDLAEASLTPYEKQKSIGYMRVNHSGEVCAQALYHGQLILSQNSEVKQLLAIAAMEETDHLSWCKERIYELGGYTSYLNIFWYINAFLIGLLVGAAGDRWSLSFVEETEQQVSAHLENHLYKLPAVDLKSRSIVKQMQIDEMSHGQKAKLLGTKELPYSIKKIMSIHAKVMTTLSYWV